MTTSPTAEMTCRQFVEIVTEYLERQLDEARRLWTDEHLAGCEACRNYLDQMQRTIAAMRALGETALDTARRDEILAAMATPRPPP